MKEKECHDYPIGGIDDVLVEVTSRYKNETGYKGIGGQDIVMDTRYEPVKYASLYGKVIQVPFALGQGLLRQIPTGIPSYGSVNPKNEDDCHVAIYQIGGHPFKRMNDIHADVEKGDTIWFKNMVMHRPENIVDEFERDGQKVFLVRVSYDLIVCIEKDEPILIGGWCFLKPLNMETKYLPTFYDMTDNNGNKIPKPKEEWIQVLVHPESSLRARLEHVGKPLKGDTFYFEKGADVFVRKAIQWRYLYKDTEYMLIKQWDIYAELIETV